MNIMKKLSVLLIAFSACVAVNAQSVVSLNISGLPDGTEIEAVYACTHQSIEPAVAEAKVMNGQCVVTVPMDEPRYVGFKVKGYNGYVAQLMTTKGETPKVTAAAEKNVTDKGTYYSGSGVKVVNSPLEAEYIKKIDAKRKYLDILYEAFHNGYTDTKSQGYAAAEKSFFTQVEKTYKAIAADNKDSWWGPFSMLALYSYFTEENTADWAQFSTEAQQSYYGQLLKKKISPEGLIGKDYPKFSFTDAKGKVNEAAKTVKGKKIFLVDFWASWCVPCRKEIPNLKSIYAANSKKGLEIISVSIDKSDAAWKKALEKENLPWPNGIDKSGVDDLYHVQAIPAIFIVDAVTGKVIGENLRGEELAAKIVDLLK